MQEESASNKKRLLGKFFWEMMFAVGIRDSRGVLYLIFSVEKEIAAKIILKLKTKKNQKTPASFLSQSYQRMGKKPKRF